MSRVGRYTPVWFESTDRNTVSWYALTKVNDKVSSGRRPLIQTDCESSSVGRAQPCQGWGRGFESRLSLKRVVPLRKEL